MEPYLRVSLTYGKKSVIAIVSDLMSILYTYAVAMCIYHTYAIYATSRRRTVSK